MHSVSSSSCAGSVFPVFVLFFLSSDEEEDDEDEDEDDDDDDDDVSPTTFAAPKADIAICRIRARASF